MGKNQKSYFFMRGYFTSDNQVSDALSLIGVRHYAFILHDKDVFQDDTESHHIGDLKKPHYHILVNLIQARSFRAVCNDIKKKYPDCGVMVQEMYNPPQALLYLTHESEKSIADEGKHKYDRCEVISDNYGYFLDEKTINDCKMEKVDYIIEYFDELICDGCIYKNKYLHYCHLYGRDFIFNVGKVIQQAEKILKKSLEIIDENI